MGGEGCEYVGVGVGISDTQIEIGYKKSGIFFFWKDGGLEQEE